MKIKLIDKIKDLVDKPESYIKVGKVFVNNQKIDDPNYQVRENDSIKIIAPKKYVSRGAYKLLEAIKIFNINFHNQIVLDIGSSTGGFTQVALENGAKKVYALDVGTNQLAFKLRNDSRVIVLEKTNLKKITKSMFNEDINIVVVDVAFISLRNVFDILKNFNNIIVMALIKPQYEAFKDEVLKGGVVDKSIHGKIIDKIKAYAFNNNFKCTHVANSPIRGEKAKNQEYISLFIKE